MDQFIKNSIDARRDAFTKSYRIKDENLINKINDLFQKIEKLGAECHDVMDFETKFASSPLNKEYTDLFTEIATSSEAIIPEKVDEHKSSNGKAIVDEIASDAKYIAKDLTMPLRRKAREEFDSKMRDTPLGKIEQINNMRYLFKRFSKKKKDE